jgi:hypothetical protein
MQVVKMDNRAWKGIRLVTETIKLCTDYNEKIPLKEQNIPIGTHLSHTYEITRHIPLNYFMLTLEYEKVETFVSSIKAGYTFVTKGSYAGSKAFSKSIAPLIALIEKWEGVKIEVTDPNLVEQEKYDIEDNERVLKKIPSWRTTLKLNNGEMLV